MSVIIESVPALQAFVVARVRQDNDLRRLGVSTVFDRVPAKARPPYVTFGPEQETREPAEMCLSLCSTVDLQLDVWTDSVGRNQASKIAAALRALLDDSSGTEGDVDVQEMMLQSIQDVPSEDGLTSHLALQFRCLLQAV